MLVSCSKILVYKALLGLSPLHIIDLLHTQVVRSITLSAVASLPYHVRSAASIAIFETLIKNVFVFHKDIKIRQLFFY